MKKLCSIFIVILSSFPILCCADICIQNTNSFLGDNFITTYENQIASALPGLTSKMKYKKGMAIKLFRSNLQSFYFVAYLYPDGDRARYKIWSFGPRTSWKQIPNDC